jgi:hypothetical protein
MRRGQGSWTPAFDYLLALLGIFLIIAITEKPKTTPMRIDTLGLYAVTVTWPGGSNDDVDLWVQDPQGNLSWFGALTSASMTLNGDDLGCSTGTGYGQDKKTCLNGERTIIKAALPGEYTVNVHMYSKNDPGPTQVTCSLWELRGNDRTLITKKVTLAGAGQEETCFRFTLDVSGNASNFNTLPKRFVGAAPAGRGPNG